MYFGSRDLSAIAICSALWFVLNTWISPIFFQFTRMPFLCDLLGFASLSLVIWWTRRFGSSSLTGLIVAVLSLIARPTALQMIGFVAASILFDILTRAIGYRNILERSKSGHFILVVFSTLCAGLAGLIIGSFFMGYKTVTPILIWTGLHAVGGLIGGIIGAIIIKALAERKISSLISEPPISTK